MKQIISTRGSKVTDKNSFIIKDIDDLKAEGRQLLVKILSVSINPADVKIRAGENLDEPTKILGYDAYGTVEALGSKSTLFKVGDKVYYSGDVTKDGSNATHQLVDERIVGNAPKSLNASEIAALPLTAITAWEAIFDRLGFIPKKDANKGKSILIVGGAGGVGSMAIQLAKWSGLTTFATASRKESKDWCLELGADKVIKHGDELKNAKQELGEEVNAVFGTQGTEKYWDIYPTIIKPQGALVLIDDPEINFDIMKYKTKSISINWELMFTRSIFTTDDIQEQHNLLNKVAELIDSSVIKTTLNTPIKGFSVESLRKAHELVETGKSIGKVVIEY